MSWLKYYSDQNVPPHCWAPQNHRQIYSKVTHWSLTSDCIVHYQNMEPRKRYKESYLFWYQNYYNSYEIHSEFRFRRAYYTVSLWHLPLLQILKVQVRPCAFMGAHKATHIWDIREHIYLSRFYALSFSFPLPLLSCQSIKVYHYSA